MATRLVIFLFNLLDIFFSLSGETVTKDEQINLNETDETLPTTQSLMSLSTATTSALSPTSTTAAAVAVGTPLGGLDNRSVNFDEWEKERTALYAQLDEKVRISNNVGL